MLFQNNQSNLLVEISAEEQQLLSGGCSQSPPPSCKPKKQKCGCDYQKYDQYTPSEPDQNYSDSGNKCGQ